MVAAKAGGMPHGVAPVEKAYSLHCLCRFVSRQHAPHNCRWVFYVHPVAMENRPNFTRFDFRFRNLLAGGQTDRLTDIVIKILRSSTGDVLMKPKCRLARGPAGQQLKYRALVKARLNCDRNGLKQEKTRSSAIAEGPHDASCQLKSCQLSRNSAETTCTTSPEPSISCR